MTKLDRAQEHLNALSAAIDAFHQGQGYLVADEFDLRDGWYVGRMRINQSIPALRWGAICGDAIQNVRSALDHTVYQLIALSGNNPKRFERNSQWPIVSDRDNYWKRKGERKPLRDIYLGGVAEKYRKLIDEFQPHDRHPGDPFVPLARISNADKHRILQAGIYAPREATLILTPANRALYGREEVVWPDKLPEPLEDGTELYRWRFPVPGWPRQIEVHVQRNIAFGIAFGQRQELLEVVLFIYDFVRKIIAERFDPLFPTSAF